LQRSDFKKILKVELDSECHAAVWSSEEQGGDFILTLEGKTMYMSQQNDYRPVVRVDNHTYRSALLQAYKHGAVLIGGEKQELLQILFKETRGHFQTLAVNQTRTSFELIAPSGQKQTCAILGLPTQSFKQLKAHPNMTSAQNHYCFIVDDEDNVHCAYTSLRPEYQHKRAQVEMDDYEPGRNLF
jgi:hypothetical protein